MRVISLVLLVFIVVLLIPVNASPVFIARGDPTYIQMDAPGGTCWIFQKYGPYGLYDFPSGVDRYNVTHCGISTKMSQGLPAGEYVLLYQKPAMVNGKPFKDISWVNNTLVSSIAGVKPIDESGKEANVVLTDLKMMIDSNGLNTYSEISLTVEEPLLKISDLGRTAENVYTVKGTSNFNDGTHITIKVDDMRYYAQRDDSFTYTSVINRQSNSAIGTWNKDMLMPIQNMTPGWHNLSVIANNIRTEVMFKIDEQEWGPKPTPTEYVKYLSDGNIAPVIVTVTVLQPPVTVYKDKWHTTTPTPGITDALGGKIEYPYSSGDTIPSWVAGIATVCIIGLVLMRGYKWN